MIHNEDLHFQFFIIKNGPLNNTDTVSTFILVYLNSNINKPLFYSSHHVSLLHSFTTRRSWRQTLVPQDAYSKLFDKPDFSRYNLTYAVSVVSYNWISPLFFPLHSFAYSFRAFINVIASDVSHLCWHYSHADGHGYTTNREGRKSNGWIQINSSSVWRLSGFYWIMITWFISNHIRWH